MIVADIREYVDELKQFYRWLPAGYPCSSSDIAHKLLKVRAMLYQLEQEQKDQLDEPEGKWVKDENGDYRCSKCKAIIENDEWERHNYNYCYHCGARMEDENEI